MPAGERGQLGARHARATRRVKGTQHAASPTALACQSLAWLCSALSRCRRSTIMHHTRNLPVSPDLVLTARPSPPFAPPLPPPPPTAGSFACATPCPPSRPPIRSLPDRLPAHPPTRSLYASLAGRSTLHLYRLLSPPLPRGEHDGRAGASGAGHSTRGCARLCTL